MRETDTSIVLAVPGNQALIVNMETVYRAEGRLSDIAFVNRETAGELLSAFNQGYSELSRAFGRVCYLVSKLEKDRKRRKAILTLDVIPEKAKEKGLANSRSPTGSEDVREAFYYSDQEFLDLTDALGAAEATKELLGIKVRSLWAAMDAVKSVTREQRPGLPNVGHNQGNENHSLDQPMMGPEERSPAVEVHSPFRRTVDALEASARPAAARVIVELDPTPTQKSTRFGKPKHD